MRPLNLNRRSSSLAIATAFAAGAAFAAPAQAQGNAGASAAAANNSDVIVVTARRKDEDIQKVPIAITAVSAETLEDLRVTQAEDLEVLEPTFSVSSSSGYVNKNVYALRGIRPTESIYGQDPTVQLYLAEVVQSPSQGSNLGFYDLENVQILKGPQGTLFGRNNIGGAVLLTPRKPSGEFGIDLMAGVGEYGLYEAEAGIDIPLAPTFNVRIAGRFIDSDGYQTNTGPGPFQGTKYGGEETRSLRMTWVADLNDRIQNTTMWTYDKRDTNGRSQVIQAINLDPAVPGSALPLSYDTVFGGAFSAALARAQNRGINDVESDIANYDNVEAWSFTNTTVAELSDYLTFKSIFNYREVDAEAQIDLDATIERILHSEDQFSNLNHHSVELQLQGDGDRFDWVLGGYYYHEAGTEFSPGVFFPAFLAAINPIQQSAAADNDSFAVFAQGSYNLSDQLTLTIGGRMNWDKKRLTLQTRNGANCGLRVLNDATPDPTDSIALPNNACEVPLSDSFSSPTGTISLDYQVTPDVLLYATSRLGYRSGGFNLRATAPGNYLPFNEETVIDIESGIKSEYALGMVDMRTNIAVYHQWYDDIQRTIATPDPVTTQPGSSVVNAAKATVFGIEVQQMIRPADWLTFDLSYAYVKPKYQDFLEEPTPGTFVDVSNTPFPFTPRHSGAIRMTIEQELGDAGTFRFIGNASWQDDIWINSLHTQRIIDEHPTAILPLLQQDDYWLVDISAGLSNIGGSGIDVSGYVRNLFDKEYKIGGIQLYTGASGFIAAAFGRPRTAGVQVRYSY